jgi:L-lactate dehydrogenase complex protein LldG
MTTREAFFTRIRAGMAQGPAGAAARAAERPAHPGEAAELIRRQLRGRWPATLVRFRAEFEAVGGVFHRLATAAEVPDAIGGLARARRAQRLVAWHPQALGVDWAPSLAAAGLAVEPMPEGEIGDEGRRPALRRLIAEADLGLTGVDLAVAETGSLVLVAGRGRPRSTSLLPPCHVAVFGPDALVESLVQVGVFLEAWHGGEAPAWKGGAINIITGPSRTADIELTLIQGVHGPRELHAIFVDSPLPPAGGGHA